MSKAPDMADWFQSTHSLRSATGCGKSKKERKSWFQSTHSLRSATINLMLQRPHSTGFNPRTPCGVRHQSNASTPPQYGFQSTHSLRSATSTSCGCGIPEPGFNPRTPCGVRPLPAARPLRNSSGFNPRTPCGVRRSLTTREASLCQVSIHALLAECDLVGAGCMGVHGVSIHALLAECDINLMLQRPHSTGFNPRTPCGVRRLRISM